MFDESVGDAVFSVGCSLIASAIVALWSWLATRRRGRPPSSHDRAEGTGRGGARVNGDVTASGAGSIAAGGDIVGGDKTTTNQSVTYLGSGDAASSSDPVVQAVLLGLVFVFIGGAYVKYVVPALSMMLWASASAALLISGWAVAARRRGDRRSARAAVGPAIGLGVAAVTFHLASGATHDGLAMRQLHVLVRGVPFGDLVTVLNEGVPGGLGFSGFQALGVALAAAVAVGSVLWFVGTCATSLLERGAEGGATRWLAVHADLPGAWWLGVVLVGSLSMALCAGVIPYRIPGFA